MSVKLIKLKAYSPIGPVYESKSGQSVLRKLYTFENIGELIPTMTNILPEPLFYQKKNPMM